MDRREIPSLENQGEFTVNEQVLPVSVIICNRDRAGLLDRCLASVTANRVSEVIVVDGKSIDGSQAVAASYGVTMLDDGRRGLGYARRLGVMHATQPFVMFLDSDVIVPDPELVSSLLKELIERGYDGLHASVVADAVGNVWERAQQLHFDYRFNLPGPRSSVGCIAVLFRRNTLAACLPDPLFTGAGEDGDLSERIRRRGGLLGVSRSTVVHVHRSSLRALWAQRSWYGKGNARRAIKSRSVVPLVSPIATAAYLITMAALKRAPALVPYAVIHAFGCLWGETVELTGVVVPRRFRARGAG